MTIQMCPATQEERRILLLSFLQEADPRETLKMLFNAEAEFVIGDRPIVFDREFSHIELLNNLVEADVKLAIRLNMGSKPPHF